MTHVGMQLSLQEQPGELAHWGMPGGYPHQKACQ